MPKRISSKKKATKLLNLYTKKLKKYFKKKKLGKKLKEVNFRFVIGVLILILGVFLMYQYQNIRKIKSESENVAHNKTITNKEPIKAAQKGLDVPVNTKDPLVRLMIPKKGVDVGIVEANVVNGYWELSETSGSHGVGSAYPGMKGNTVIFAHAREGLFLNLREVVVGEEILVFSKNKWFKYKVTSIKQVYPNQVEVIEPTKDERLTLFTCDGFADEKRLIVVAKPSK